MAIRAPDGANKNYDYEQFYALQFCKKSNGTKDFEGKFPKKRKFYGG